MRYAHKTNKLERALLTDFHNKIWCSPGKTHIFPVFEQVHEIFLFKWAQLHGSQLFLRLKKRVSKTEARVID